MREAVIVSTARTPLTKAHRGILSPVRLPIPPSRQRKTAIMTHFGRPGNTFIDIPT